MLRETRARWLAFGTAVAITLAAAAFAWLRNLPHDAPAGTTAAQADPAEALHAGRAFERLRCGMCHAIDGRGNPASPLDGIGARLDRSAIRDWSIGAGAARARLPEGLVAVKSRVAEDPDLDVLVDYLAASR